MPLPPSEWWETDDVVYPFCPMRMQYVASHSDGDVLGFQAGSLPHFRTAIGIGSHELIDIEVRNHRDCLAECRQRVRVGTVHCTDRPWSVGHWVLSVGENGRYGNSLVSHGR